jgi:molybdenum cofactor synthesis domain-containing protein
VRGLACTVEIISVGNELLIGKIANTNAQWMARKITSLSGNVRRIVDIGDDLQEISTAVKEALARRPTLLLITGGLGPTFDDMTLEGLAEAFNIPLRIDPEAERMVRARYERYEAETGRKIEMTPERLKMAKLPEGSRPIRNPAGTAPGVVLQHGSTTIVALPGVPREMEAIFEEFVEPMVKKAVGNLHFYAKSLEAIGVIESELAPLIEKTMRENPRVYIKSHPKAPEPRPLIELHFSTTSEHLELAEEEVEKAARMLTQLVVEHKGSIREVAEEG